MLTRRDLIAAGFALTVARPLAAMGKVLPAALPGDGVRRTLITLDESKRAEFIDSVGEYGVISIRNADRYSSLLGTLVNLGWKRPTELALDAVNFARSSIVGIIETGDVANQWELEAAKPGGVHARLAYTIYKQRDRVVNTPKILLFEAPSTTNVELSSYHPHNGGNYPSPDKALVEWSGAVGSDGGEEVGGLTATITPVAPKVRLGDDILLSFEIGLSAAERAAGQFCRQPKSLWVWDGKYSNGYRNHAFHVRSPDGTTAIYRVPERGFDKNIPHPVEVTATKPYRLPNWVEGDKTKSLKAHGVTLSKAGDYQITGIYQEQERKESVSKHPIWCGDVWSNTITVRVEA